MGTVVMIVRKISFQENPLKKSKKINKKNAHLENLTTKKMSTESTVYYDGYGKEVKKNYHQENVTSKKMSTKSSVYYDGYGSYDCPKIFFPIEPFKEVEKKMLI